MKERTVKKTPQEIFVIEKNIPIPSRGKQFPFKKMQVNDSFSSNSNIGIYAAAKKDGVKVVIRKQKDGWRVWRVK